MREKVRIHGWPAVIEAHATINVKVGDVLLTLDIPLRPEVRFGEPHLVMDFDAINKRVKDVMVERGVA